MDPCKLGSSALGLMSEFSLLCASTKNTLTSISDLLAHVELEKRFLHLVFRVFLYPRCPAIV